MKLDRDDATNTWFRPGGSVQATAVSREDGIVEIKGRTMDIITRAREAFGLRDRRARILALINFVGAAVYELSWTVSTRYYEPCRSLSYTSQLVASAKPN
jgi:hypothetical protein